jgi:hypothetical protein
MLLPSHWDREYDDRLRALDLSSLATGDVDGTRYTLTITSMVLTIAIPV